MDGGGEAQAERNKEVPENPFSKTEKQLEKSEPSISMTHHMHIAESDAPSHLCETMSRALHETSEVQIVVG